MKRGCRAVYCESGVKPILTLDFSENSTTNKSILWIEFKKYFNVSFWIIEGLYLSSIFRIKGRVWIYLRNSGLSITWIYFQEDYLSDNLRLSISLQFTFPFHWDLLKAWGLKLPRLENSIAYSSWNPTMKSGVTFVEKFSADSLEVVNV